MGTTGGGGPNINNPNIGPIWNGVGPGPAPGSYNSPSDTGATGYSNTVPNSTAVNAPGGYDYTAWNWEQVLNSVLGFNLPSRDEIAALRWTVTGKNEGTSLYRIFSATWSGNGSIYVYLNPSLQGGGGPWDEYYNTPRSHLVEVLTQPPNYTTLPIDPRSFATVAVALGGVEDTYLNAADTFNNMASDLKSESTQFKGQAGEAFYQLINNLFHSALSISTQMGNSESPSSYSGMVMKAGNDAANFVSGIWNTLQAWEGRLDHSPLGAIFQALLDGNVLSGPTNPDGPSSYHVNNPLTAGSYGNILSDAGWLSVETAAKQLWKQSIQQTLDTGAQNYVNMLSVSYLDTAGVTKALTQPTLTPIAPPNGVNGNMGDLNSSLGNLNGMGGLNGGMGGLNGGMGGLNGGMGDLNSLGGIGGNLSSLGGLNGLNGGLNGGPNGGLNGGLNGLGGINNLATNGPGGINGLTGGLNGPGGLNNLTSNGPGGISGLSGVPGGITGLTNGLITPGGLNGLTGGLSGMPGGPLGNPALGQLQTALGDSNQVQRALRQALAEAPSSGPLHNALEAALAANGNVQSALQGALAGGTPIGTALQTALTGNGKVQSALNQALASGQVPSRGPLRTALQQAAGDNAHTKNALQNALGAIPGGTSMHAALADTGKLQSALRHALASGQVPATGPLHNALESALANAGKARHALDQALATGGTPGTASIQQAVADNRAAQNELEKALASGQVPATGPLHHELLTALADSRNVGTALHQALTNAGIVAEPNGILTGLPSGGGLRALLGGANGLGGAGGPALTTGPGFTGVGGHAALTGPAVASGLSGLTGGAPGVQVSSGRFVAPSTGALVSPAAVGQGAGAVPFYPPMAGGMGMGMGQQGGVQERERTTWLAEDEDIWGTEPSVGPTVIGRDLVDVDDELDSYDDFTEPGTASRRSQSRLGAH